MDSPSTFTSASAVDWGEVWLVCSDAFNEGTPASNLPSLVVPLDRRHLLLAFWLGGRAAGVEWAATRRVDHVGRAAIDSDEARAHHVEPRGGAQQADGVGMAGPLEELLG